jgi:putative addiction module killer protein
LGLDFDNIYVIIAMGMIVLQEYLDSAGQNRYRSWFKALDVDAAAKAAVALERMVQGNKSSIQPVGEGVSECKIDFGPGYRIYFGKDGDQLIILLGGGSKKRQSRDIEDAKTAWREYKHRKKAALKDVASKALTKSRHKAEWRPRVKRK